MDREVLYNIAYPITLGILVLASFGVYCFIKPIVNDEDVCFIIGALTFLLLLIKYAVSMTDKLVEIMERDSRRDNRLIALGLEPAKPNVLARIYYALTGRGQQRCICGRPLGKVWRVNVDIFNGYVYDPRQGIGTEWILDTICIYCYRKNIETLKILEKEGKVKVEKEAYNRIDSRWVWKPINEINI